MRKHRAAMMVLFSTIATAPTLARGGTASIYNLGTLGGSEAFATNINALGQVVGASYPAGDADYHPFLYTGIPGNGGTMADLGTFGGTFSRSQSINDIGQIVGGS